MIWIWWIGCKLKKKPNLKILLKHRCNDRLLKWAKSNPAVDPFVSPSSTIGTVQFENHCCIVLYSGSQPESWTPIGINTKKEMSMVSPSEITLSTMPLQSQIGPVHIIVELMRSDSPERSCKTVLSCPLKTLQKHPKIFRCTIYHYSRGKHTKPF